MTALVSYAVARRRRGAVIDALVCASTGDTSAALAAYGARAGIPVVVLLPAGKVSLAQLVQPLAHGARVVAVDGDFDACMRVVVDVARRPGVVLANSKNPLRLLGQSTVAFEIVDKLGRAPDFVLVPSGNLGNVSALARGFRLLKKKGRIDALPRLVACQVGAANPLFRAFEWAARTAKAPSATASSRTSPRTAATMAMTKEPLQAQETHATAIRIGDPVSWPRAVLALAESDGLVTSTSEEALLLAMVRADRQGLFVCPQTATAIDGLEQLRARGTIGDHHTAVVIATASGLKFAAQKAAFHAGSTVLGDLELPKTTAALRNPIRVVDANVDAVWKAIG